MDEKLDLACDYAAVWKRRAETAERLLAALLPFAEQWVKHQANVYPGMSAPILAAKDHLDSLPK